MCPYLVSACPRKYIVSYLGMLQLSVQLRADWPLVTMSFMLQARGSQASHQVLRDILKEVQCNMVPRSMLREWAMRTFPAATDYWMFRKTVSLLAESSCDNVNCI
jgi:hypothetical protein